MREGLLAETIYENSLFLAVQVHPPNIVVRGIAKLVSDPQLDTDHGLEDRAERLEAICGRIQTQLAAFGLRRLGYYYNRWYNWYGVPGAATVTVTARWGWQAIPSMIQESCKIIAKDVLMQRNSDIGFGLVAVTDAGGVGTRENWIVRSTPPPLVGG